MTAQDQMTLQNLSQAPELEANRTLARDQMVERVYNAVNSAFDAFSIYIGYKLGYYKAMAQHGATTSTALAKRTGTHERYTREWLEHQTVTGILQVLNPEAGPMERMFLLPAGHDEVLSEEDSPNFMAPMTQIMVGVTRPMDSLLKVYRTGGGLDLSEYGEDFIYGQGTVNRTAFLQDLGQVWLPAMPDVHARLLSDTPARVADIGCGVGWSSIGMALQYPTITVDGYDLDEPSIEIARENARAYGVEDRVRFFVQDAASPELDGHYDLVTAFECVHDMTDPINALQTMRRMANQTGTVLVVDERVGESFMTASSDVEPIMYGYSVLHCLPVGMNAENAAGTGTVMRPGTLRQYARAAGFRDIEALPVENFFFRLYRMVNE